MKKGATLVVSCVAIATMCVLVLGGEERSQTESQPDYTSRVPKYTFGDTLEEQEAQLKTNPMIQRFIESRKEMASDPYRPIYHYVNPEGPAQRFRTDSLSGRAVGTCSTRGILQRIRANTGATPSATIWSTGEISHTRSTPIPNGLFFQAQLLLNKTV